MASFSNEVVNGRTSLVLPGSQRTLLVIDRVGSGLDRATTSDAALNCPAETIARSLRLPYVRVLIEDRSSEQADIS